MAEAPLPANYERLFTVVETQARSIPEAGTINSKSSWVLNPPEHHAACVALLEYHVDARALTAWQAKTYRRRWASAVDLHVLNAVNTCLGITC